MKVHTMRRSASALRKAILIVALLGVGSVVVGGGAVVLRRVMIAMGVGERPYYHVVGMGLALRSYATDHGGFFPTGGHSPEESLALLCTAQYGVSAEMLAADVTAIDSINDSVARGVPLAPDLCAWHYVEGLRMGEDPKLALLWEKDRKSVV